MPRRAPILAFVFVSVAFAFVLPARAASQPAAARLVYDRGSSDAPISECPDEDAFRASVASRLGYDPFATRPSPAPAAVVRVRVRIEVSGAGLLARVAIDDPDRGVAGEREIATEKRDCIELVEATAVAVAIALDPSSVAPSPPSAPPPAPTSSPPPASSADAGTSADVASKPSTPPPIRATVAGHVAFGMEPRPAFGATLAIGARWADFSIDAEGRADLAASTSSGSSGARGGASASALLASAVPCVHRGVVAVCGILSIGALQGRGEGLDHPRATSAFIGAAGARLGGEIGLARGLAIVVRADLLAPLVRATLRADGEELWSTPAVTAALGAGVTGLF